MISDVLSDAAHSIREYLADPVTAKCYIDPRVRAQIDVTLAQMDALRDTLDAPPKLARQWQNGRSGRG